MKPEHDLSLPKPAPDDGAPCWYVYILECADGTYYCGVTTDMERRLAQHNGLLPGGAKYTRPRRPVRVIALTACPDKSTACSLEYAVKAAPRGRKLAVLAAYPGIQRTVCAP
ncbi:GIY-YIG nuclease family protein [Desulfovibrio sp. OttesenSCG-928-I05]|nr:GIY-YIG nuclease family protein [Desulfovibrio sp. OttesenSCG-928-I05]